MLKKDADIERDICMLISVLRILKKIHLMTFQKVQSRHFHLRSINKRLIFGSCQAILKNNNI